jgi:hypothetical protein
MYRTVSTVELVDDTQKFDPSLTTLSTTADGVDSMNEVARAILSQASTVAIVRAFTTSEAETVPDDTLYPAKTKYLPLVEVVK